MSTRAERLKKAWDVVYKTEKKANKIAKKAGKEDFNLPEEEYIDDIEVDTEAITGDKVNNVDNSDEMKTAGNMVGNIGSIASGIANIINTVSTKESPVQNPFEGYAADAMAKLNESKVFVERRKSLSMADKTLSEQTQRKSNRNMARGMGAFRALSLGTHIAGMQAERAIEGQYADEMSDIAKTETSVLLDRDKTIMSGQERADDKTQANKDAFKTALSQNIVDLGTTFQSIGGVLNSEEENKIIKKSVNQSKHGFTY